MERPESSQLDRQRQESFPGIYTVTAQHPIHSPRAFDFRVPDYLTGLTLPS